MTVAALKFKWYLLFIYCPVSIQNLYFQLLRQAFCSGLDCLHRPIYLGVFCTSKFSVYENTKKEKIDHKYLQTCCGLLVFQSRISPVLGFWWHICKSCDLWLLYYQFLYCALGSLSTEFSGNSNQTCILAEKYEHLLFLLEATLKKKIQIIFTENKTKQKNE